MPMKQLFDILNYPELDTIVENCEDKASGRLSLVVKFGGQVRHATCKASVSQWQAFLKRTYLGYRKVTSSFVRLASYFL